MRNSSNRMYEISDQKMIEKAQMIQTAFYPYKERFQQCYPKLFPEDFADQLKSAIDLCMGSISDRYCKSSSAEKSEDLREAEKLFLRKYRAVRVIIEDAFANEPDKLVQLGVGTISEKQQSRDRLFNFAELFCQLIREYEDRLKEFGCTEQHIAAVETVFTQMKQIRLERDLLKVDRQNQKIERIVQLNTVWRMIRRVSRTVSIVLEPGEYTPSHFALPRRKSTGKRSSESSSAEQAVPMNDQ